MINGQIVPLIEMKEGEVQRWRFIHAGTHETIDLAISEEKDENEDENDENAWPLYEIAADGLSFGYINRWYHIELQPGYRSDILVKVPELNKNPDDNIYYLYDLASKKKDDSSEEGDKHSEGYDSLRGTMEELQILAKIIVKLDASYSVRIRSRSPSLSRSPSEVEPQLTP